MWCRYAPRQVKEFQALKIEGKMVKALTEAVAAGYSTPARRATGLHACADALASLCKLHGDTAVGDFCSEKRLNGLGVAVKQVQGIDNLPAKCKTQLIRIQKVIDRRRGDAGLDSASRRKRKRQGTGAATGEPSKANEKANKVSKKPGKT